MTQQAAVISAVTAALAADDRVAGLFLGGSYGKGTEDAFSDVDFVVVASDGADPGDIADIGRSALGTVAPVVYWTRLPFAPVFNSVLADWTRADFSFSSADDLAKRPRPHVRPLHDPSDIASRMPLEVVHPGPNPGRVQYTINEFIRVIGLGSVGAGRQEWVLMVTGVHLLRGLLTSLLTEELGLADPGGMLHLSRLISPDDLAMLAALPVPSAEPASLAAANLAVARAFFPRAKHLAERIGVTWPTVFEEAARVQVAAFCAVPLSDTW